MGAKQKRQHLTAAATGPMMALLAIYEKLSQVDGAFPQALELKYLIDKLGTWQNKYSTKKVR